MKKKKQTRGLESNCGDEEMASLDTVVRPYLMWRHWNETRGKLFKELWEEDFRQWGQHR